ncbi:MAG: DUF2851 family protein [Prevotella sp.]|nr:DUF2851 family protein [Prevotella sp.]
MNERELLAYCWRYGLFGSLSTSKGWSPDITDPGLRNRHEGPAFFNAKVKIQGTLWVGNVEILEKASDWHLNLYDENSKYDNVVLVIVGQHDTDIVNSQGSFVTVAEAEVPKDVRERLQRLLSDEGLSECIRWNAENCSRLVFHSWASALQTEYLEQESDRAKRLAQESGQWDDALLAMTARYYGARVSDTMADTMERWAMQLPKPLLYRYRGDLFLLEALMLGQAGLLELEAIPEAQKHETLMEGYFTKQRNEYLFLMKKHSLRPMDYKEWEGESPHVIIARLANMYYNNTFSMLYFVKLKTMKEFSDWFRISVTPYWETHRHYGLMDKQRSEKRPTADRLNEIVATVAVPMLFAYGRFRSEEQMCDIAFDIMEQTKPMKNTAVKEFAELGFDTKSGLVTLALSHLKKEYCMKKDCLRCRFGYNYIRQK